MNRLLAAFATLLVAVAASEPIRLCVPRDYFAECQQMLRDTESLEHNFKCVEGLDRQDCVDKIVGPYLIYQMSPQADVMYAEPEDMLLAYQRSNSTFRAVMQTRTKEEPEAEFRYESVAVVPADSTAKSLQDLKGLKSCHTGVGRNAGYKIPFDVLTKAGVMKADDDPNLSVRESELKAFSHFFSKSCIVGKWSSHEDVNKKMKEKYSNLCAMCEKPEQCDYPDTMSGYDGALRCLATNGGQVAFTKVIAVKKFFGLSHGRVPAQKSEHDHTKFMYLCPDGSKKPLDGPACSWAARPWPTFIVNENILSEDKYTHMRENLMKISELGENKHATWRKNVFGLEDYNVLSNIEPISPLQYLKKAGYYDVLTRKQEVGPLKAVHLCEVIRGFFTSGKCEKLSSSAFSRGVRPRIECIHEDSIEKCLEAVKTGRAEAVFADPHDAYTGIQNYNLKPLMMEKYGEHDHQYLAIIVPKDTPARSIKDFKGKRLCWWKKKSEFDVALEVFADARIVEKRCPYENQANDFAYGSTGAPTCLSNPTVTINGGQKLYDDAMLRPLVPTLGKDYERYHPEDKFVLLCPPSPHRTAKMPLSDVNICNHGDIPPKMLMVKENMGDLQKDELIAMFTKIGEIYSQHPEYFRFFGDLHENPDQMVSNTATGFEVVKGEVPAFEHYKKLLKDIETCQLGH